MKLATLTDDQLRHVEVYGSFWERVDAKQEAARRHEIEVKRGRNVGDVIEFVRFGDAVEFSTNRRDGTPEVGMSCYMLDNEEVVFVGWHFGIIERPAYRGRGEIVGWGSDCEPLVRVIGECSRAPEFDREATT